MPKLAVFFCKGSSGNAPPPELRGYHLRFPALHVQEADGSFQALFLSHKRFSIHSWRSGIEEESAILEEYKIFGRGGRRPIAETLDTLIAAHRRVHAEMPLPPHFVSCEQYLKKRRRSTASPPPLSLSQPLRRLKNQDPF